MGDSKKTVNVRLPADLANKFDRLAGRVPGLPKSVLLRLCLREILDRPIEDQIEIVTRQIINPKADGARTEGESRLVRNSRNRLAK